MRWNFAEFFQETSPRIKPRRLISGCGDSNGDDGGRSDAHCTARIWAPRNNMKVDFRRTDSSARRGADNTRKDNN
jgi:hypothetical protein